MTHKLSYVFGAAVALGTAAGIAQHADAANVTAALFNFETSGAGLVATPVTSPTFGPFAAEVGVGTGSAVHASAGTVYTSPAGSGSPRSLSTNNFTAGDYFQFSVPTTTLDSIQIGFDAVSSSTGPKVFSLAYSTGGAFQAFGNYILNTGTVTAFATGATNSAVHFTFDFSGIAALNNNALASFRLVMADTTTATGGTSRIDNFIVTGNSLSVAAVPAPAALTAGAFGLAALATKRRRDA